MNEQLSTGSIEKRFEYLRKVLTSEKFLKGTGYRMEIPFFICPYPPKDMVAMQELLSSLKKEVEKEARVLEINLYDLVITYLKNEGLLETLIDYEKTGELPPERMRETLQSVLDPKTVIASAIEEAVRQEKPDILFLTGVGQVYPYIRSHTVLNNLHTPLAEQKTVLFFPGEYRYSPEKGTMLDLFGRIHDDRYYRAFNIYEFTPSSEVFP